MWEVNEIDSLVSSQDDTIFKHKSNTVFLSHLLDMNYSGFSFKLNTKGREQERTLYLAVVLQALLDATSSSSTVSSSDINVVQRQANTWFFSPSKSSDFEDVCDLAGIDPDYTRTLAKKVIKSNEITFIRKRLYALLS
jgi:hypothetical protein